MIAVYIVLVLGISTIFWSFVGIMRFCNEKYIRHVVLGPPLSGRALGLLQRWPLANRIGSNVHGVHALPGPRAHRGQLLREHGRRRAQGEQIMPADVAVLVAAHNEALVISETIRAASALVPLRNIHVVSDMSSDDTAAIAGRAGVRVLELEPNRGKAGALAEGISQFELCRKFKVVMMLDADTRPTPDYLETGLPLFSDPSVAAVAGRAKSIMTPAAPTALGRFLVHPGSVSTLSCSCFSSTDRRPGERTWFP